MMDVKLYMLYRKKDWEGMHENVNNKFSLIFYTL